MGHVENAVEHYTHLRVQGLSQADAITHTTQRFGISADVLMERVAGRVADPARTREVLAKIKSRLPDERARDAVWLLNDLYEAVTGESLPA